nr:hypothetical protein CFP56_38602 [Quercus suber]
MNTKNDDLGKLLKLWFQNVEIQNILRSQAYKSKKDLVHGSEKKKEGLGLKMEEEGWTCKKKEISFGPYRKGNEEDLAQG